MTDIAIADAIPETLTPVPSSPALDEALIGSPDRFINRELSWLAFNERVLEESENPRHPLLERLRFLSISAGNLDEFYMVRVAGLKDLVREGIRVVSQEGLTAVEQLARINDAAAALMGDQQRRWRQLRGQLKSEGLMVIEAADRNAGMREQLWPTIGLALGIEALLSRADAVKALEPEAYTRLDTEAVLVRSFLDALAGRLDAALYRSGPARQG